jgi:hypothetical protein
MWKRMLIVVTALVLGVGGSAAAQNRQGEMVQKDGTARGVRANTIAMRGAGPMYLYKVSFQTNGVVVRADRAVINQREVTLEGHVRMTLPAPK